ncbi:MAG: S46 family peptidase [Bacteroidota bacterium]|nr:S46 family peptidase [Bacteroidota bacterium]
MKKISLLVLAMLLMTTTLFAKPKQTPAPDEGMWLPMFFRQLNYEDMKRLGLQLSAEELYSFNNSSLKDAIVQMGQFCTGEIVSESGLMFTNHHCGYDAIAGVSTVEHDYLSNGFWAESYEQEIPIEGLYVSFLRQMYDVTDEVLGEHVKDLNKSRWANEIQAKIDELKEKYSEEGKYRVEVKDFFEGNEYYLFVYEQFDDVRLVGAPPSSIGKFGGDTDNWMWPRHTGDFSIFRIYADKDNNPAAYSKDNVPYKPKHYLPISIAGVEKDDFAMIWGYPGTTDRYMTSYEVENTLNISNPAIVKAGNYMLPVMKKNMDRDNAVRLKYASDYASMMNMWKNKQGESRGLKRLHIYDKKKGIEDNLLDWIASDGSREKYNDVIQTLKTSAREMANSPTGQASWYHNLGLYMSQRASFALRSYMVLMMGESGVFADVDYMDILKQRGAEHFAKCDQQTEKELFAALLKMETELPQEYALDYIKSISKDINKSGGVEKYTEQIFKKSVLGSEENFNKFAAKKPSVKKLSKDPLVSIVMAIYTALINEDDNYAQASQNLANARQNFVQALREMNPNLVRYPDANFTMRMTYGTVLDYYPADAIHYDFVTTIDGIMEKEDPTNDEFIVPEKLKDLYAIKDYGQYADKNGNMTVCFLTNNDITGGNSGSPVINGKGELIGLAFDGNWEAMSGDIAFEPELQRTICVDARYVLFIIDKYAGCKRLINELKIVK